MRFVLVLVIFGCGSDEAPAPDYDFDPPDEEDLYGIWDENVSDGDVAEIEFSEPDLYVKRTGYELTEYERGQFAILPDQEFPRGVYPGFQLSPTGGTANTAAITGYDGTMIYFDGSESHTYSRR